MLFGGEQSSFTDFDNTTVILAGMNSYNNTVYRLFRETFGSDLDRDVDKQLKNY
jgi:urate oxidase